MSTNIKSGYISRTNRTTAKFPNEKSDSAQIDDSQRLITADKNKNQRNTQKWVRVKN